MNDKFCLKWNDFKSNASKTFGLLRDEDFLQDVTLVGDDNSQIEAHKVVLSACSEYFKDIFKNNKHSHPLLCLEGVTSAEVKNILDYIYNGEVNIYQEELNRFFELGQRFKLRGPLSKERIFDVAQRELEGLPSIESKEEIQSKEVLVNNPANMPVKEEKIDIKQKNKRKTREKMETEINPPPDGVRACPFCSVCVNDVFGKSLKLRLEKHVRNRHPDMCGTTIPWQFGIYRKKCKFCLREFSPPALNLHIKRKHDPTLKTTSCELCGKTFHPTNLHNHMVRCHSPGDVECTICHKTFKPYALNRHVKLIHENVRNQQCPECGKRFEHMWKLRKHKMAVHQKLKPFKCDSCDFLCGTISNLNQHRRKVHSAAENLTTKNFNNLSLEEIEKKYTQLEDAMKPNFP